MGTIQPNLFHRGVPEPSKETSVIAMIDTDSPSFAHVARILLDMRAAGVELGEAAVAIAIKMGAHAYATDDTVINLPVVTKIADVDRPVVYYIRRANFIKIGKTCEIRKRMNGLMPDEVLAVEPGDGALERQRLAQFRAHQATVGVEYFHPAEELIQHVIAVRDQHGAPPNDIPSINTESPKWWRGARRS